MEKDLYEVLGLNKNASESEIKSAYRKLAMKYHPDRYATASEQEKNSAAEKFKEINHAYEVLSDPTKKSNYDQFGSEDGPQGFGGFGGSGAGFGGFEDILNSFFGGGSSRQNRANAPQEGADIQVRVDLTFEEAFKGVSKTIEVYRDEKCTTCGGSGAKDSSSIETCSYCHGSGFISRTQNTLFGQQVVRTVCNHCGGKGKTIKDKCRDCRGTGFNRKKASIKVNIPAGVDSGINMTVRHEGHAGKNGGPNGNLVISLFVKPSDRFKRVGNDLFIDVPISFYEAAKGTEITIETLKGICTTKVPDGIQSGTKIKIKGYGMKILQKEQYGDLYITIKVETPKSLSRRQLELLKAFEDELSESQMPEKKKFKKH